MRRMCNNEYSMCVCVVKKIDLGERNVSIRTMAKNYSGKTAAYKRLIADMEAAMKECVEPTDAQKKKILEMIGPLVAHIHAPVCDDDSESDDSESESESDSESDSESESDDSESDEEEIVCKGDVCKRVYKEGPRAKGRRLYKKNGGSEEEWRQKSDKFKDSYYNKNRSLEAA